MFFFLKCCLAVGLILTGIAMVKFESVADFNQILSVHVWLTEIDIKAGFGKSGAKHLYFGLQLKD